MVGQQFANPVASTAKLIFINFFTIVLIQRLDDKRLAKRLQELSQESEASRLAIRMISLTDSPQMSKKEYVKRP